MDDLARVLPFVHVFMPNTQEAAALTNSTSRAEAATFLSMGCAVVSIITLGPTGALLASKDGVLAAPALEIEAVDQTGAGDAFAAGFIAGMIRKTFAAGLAPARFNCRGLGLPPARPPRPRLHST